jgi:chromosomal replication initiator protein
MAILKRKAEFDGLDLPDDVLVYIAENVTSNVRELEGTLIRLLAFSSISGCEIDVNVAREVLSHYQNGSGAKRIGPNEICKQVAIVFGIQEAELLKKRRTQPVALARQIAMYLCRELTDNSLNTIGLYFGGRDHSTVVHAVKLVKELVRKDREIAERVARIKEVL